MDGNIGLEQVSLLPAGGVVSSLQSQVHETSKPDISEDELFQRVEDHLLEKIAKGDGEAPFLLGQFYYEEGLLEKAIIQFERIKDIDYQKKGVEMMMKIATSESPRVRHIKHAAQYNIGRAYFEGYGVRQSDKEAEKWWLLAADDGNPKASVLAQTILGMFYARPDFLDLRKSFFWHSEACGNGSLESQGILGVMYMHGSGIKCDQESALECLKEAAQRGNVYAQGKLVELYYGKKLYTKAYELARRVVAYTDVERIAQETQCLQTYIIRGIALAAVFLSRCLHCGNGVKKDEEEAKRFFQKACDMDPGTANDFYSKISYGLL